MCEDILSEVTDLIYFPWSFKVLPVSAHDSEPIYHKLIHGGNQNDNFGSTMQWWFTDLHGRGMTNYHSTATTQLITCSWMIDGFNAPLAVFQLYIVAWTNCIVNLDTYKPFRNKTYFVYSKIGWYVQIKQILKRWNHIFRTYLISLYFCIYINFV
jgi:hypothetical protein